MKKKHVTLFNSNFSFEFLDHMNVDPDTMTITEGIFKGFRIEVLKDGKCKFSKMNKEGTQAIFSATFNSPTYDEESLIDCFIVHISKASAKKIVTMAHRDLIHKEKYDLKAEDLPNCVLYMPPAFYLLEKNGEPIKDLLENEINFQTIEYAVEYANDKDHAIGKKDIQEFQNGVSREYVKYLNALNNYVVNCSVDMHPEFPPKEDGKTNSDGDNGLKR